MKIYEHLSLIQRDPIISGLFLNDIWQRSGWFISLKL